MSYSFDETDDFFDDEQRLTHLTKDRPRRVRNKKPTVFNGSSSLDDLNATDDSGAKMEEVKESLRSGMKIPSVLTSVVLRKTTESNPAINKFRHTYQPTLLNTELEAIMLKKLPREEKAVFKFLNEKKESDNAEEKPTVLRYVPLRPVNKPVGNKENETNKSTEQESPALYKLPVKQLHEELAETKRKSMLFNNEAPKQSTTNFGQELLRLRKTEHKELRTTEEPNDVKFSSSVPFRLHNDNDTDLSKFNKQSTPKPVEEHEVNYTFSKPDLLPVEPQPPVRFRLNPTTTSSINDTQRKTINFNAFLDKDRTQTPPVQFRLNSTNAPASTNNIDMFKLRKTTIYDETNGEPVISKPQTEDVTPKFSANLLKPVNEPKLETSNDLKQNSIETARLRPVAKQTEAPAVEVKTDRWQTKSIKDRIRILSTETCETEYERARGSCPVCEYTKQTTNQNIEIPKYQTKTCPTCFLICDQRFNLCPLCSHEFKQDKPSETTNNPNSNYLYRF